MAAFIVPEDVRRYLGLPNPATDPGGQYADAVLTPFIATAEGYLALKTGRQFAAETATKTFRPRGSYVRLPDLRAATTVTYDTRVLVADIDYWLVEDVDHPGIYVAMQLTFSVARSTVPLMLAIAGDWGHSLTPAELLTADVTLSAWLAKSPDAVLGGVIQVGEGAFLDISKLPAPAYNFIVAWDRGAVVG